MQKAVEKEEKIVKKFEKSQKKRDGTDPDNPVRIYVDGCYDLFHYGHAKQFAQAKAFYKHVHLIVGISPDEEIIRLKGPIVNNEKERVNNVKNCRYVDEVIMPCPWVITKEFIEDNDIDYVAHDDIPYESGNSDDIYSYIKSIGKFKAT